MKDPLFPLRAGLGFSFLYPAVDAWFNPESWIGYIPQFALDLWPWSDAVLLHTFGAVEIVLALWIFSGRRIRIPSLIAGLMLLFIVVVNGNQFEILFRDLSIAAIAFYLGFREDSK